MGMFVRTFAVGPLGCNCTILSDLGTKKAIVIDPGGDFDLIKSHLSEHELEVTAIVHTHTHIDHVGATAPLQAHSGADAMIHESDRFLYDMLDVQARMLRLPLPSRCDMRGSLVDGGTLGFGAFELSVLHTPGHTPGSVCFYCENQGQRFVFTGDTLFARSIGRTDLWGGDSDQILRSLRERLLPLEDDTQVVPGHGRATTIGSERAQNPFLRNFRV
jgi:hydroxyacylglutathione hydrolase